MQISSGAWHQIWAHFSRESAGDEAAASERGGNLHGGIEHGFAGVFVPAGRPDDRRMAMSAAAEAASR